MRGPMIAAIYALVLTVGLAIPYLAQAECAWAMWTFTYSQSSGLERYEVDLAYPTRRECEGELSRKATILKQSGFTDVKGGFPGSGEVIGQKGNNHWRFFCLPDTIDPRGPKGITR